ncbi:MAG: hypothetical protein AMS22_05440, partial [Thiotrichales bacterium SG8_50]
YRDATSHLPTFTINADSDPSLQARRFREWSRHAALKVDHFLNPSEPAQQVAHAFARELGLPALSAQQVTWLRNKLVMKAKLRELGFSVAASQPLEAREELIGLSERWGWPLIVKWVEGFACIDTYLVDSAASAMRLRLDSSKAWMAEQFVPLKEYECCALIHDGQVLDTYLSYFPESPLAATGGAINANISVRRRPPDFTVNMTEVVQRIVDGMQLDAGYLHMELFVSPTGDYLISEVALRCAGCEIPANHGLAYGFNIFDAIIDLHLGRKPKLEYTRDLVVGDLLLPAKPGRVSRITDLRELTALPGVIDGALRFRVGDIIPNRRASHYSSGFVHVAGNSIAQVEHRMRRVLSQFVLETTLSPAAPALTAVLGD